MSTSSGQKRLLPKPPNFDIFQNDRNEAAKLQRLTKPYKKSSHKAYFTPYKANFE